MQDGPLISGRTHGIARPQAKALLPLTYPAEVLGVVLKRRLYEALASCVAMFYRPGRCWSTDRRLFPRRDPAACGVLLG
jgi:hypothetical protein